MERIPQKVVFPLESRTWSGFKLVSVVHQSTNARTPLMIDRPSGSNGVCPRRSWLNSQTSTATTWAVLSAENGTSHC
jgi:hypothetical protein